MFGGTYFCGQSKNFIRSSKKGYIHKALTEGLHKLKKCRSHCGPLNKFESASFLCSRKAKLLKIRKSAKFSVFAPSLGIFMWFLMVRWRRICAIEQNRKLGIEVSCVFLGQVGFQGGPGASRGQEEARLPQKG